MDLRPSLKAAFDAFSLPATVTVPGNVAVVTRAIWFPSQTAQVPGTVSVRKAEQGRRLALPLSDVPQVPRGTTIQVAAINGGPVRTWSVDAMVKVDDEFVSVDVVEA